MLDLKKTLKTTSKYKQILNDNNIFSIKDFLLYFPRDYENRENLKLLQDINFDDKDTVSVKIQVLGKKLLPRRGKKIYEIEVQDEEGSLAYITFFNSYLLF
ncbi:MAG: hypothetical protein GXP45_00460 [bacterium]|nr:hypothetical protein [bacterium]